MKKLKKWMGFLPAQKRGNADNVWLLILMFFMISFLGWIWEVGLYFVTDGVFVNRGFFHGPWLPIYGSGSLLILILLKRQKEHPILEFCEIILLCGCVEYGVSLYLEYAYDGMKWWDYSSYPLNLNGRICAVGLLGFGGGGMAVVYFFAPCMERLFAQLPKKLMIGFCMLLIVSFLADALYSNRVPNTGSGITNVREDLGMRRREEDACHLFNACLSGGKWVFAVPDTSMAESLP